MRKITYHQLLLGFSRQLISVQCVEHNYVPFKCSLTVVITLSLCTNELSPINDKDAKLKKQIPFANDLNKIS